jgi:hypothetical protein
LIHVSPCAWYCFRLPDPEEWQVRDDADRTWITARDGSCGMEIAAARRTGRTDEDEIAGIHERYLRDEGIQALKTVMAENPCRVVTYVTRGVGADEREHIVCHAYWKNYCAFIKFQGRRDPIARRRSQAFYDLVDSLEPLAVD